MRITIRLFAMLRRGIDYGAEADLLIADGTTVKEVVATLVDKDVAHRDVYAKAALAVNQVYVKPDTVLHDGDELAIIPPVSGG